MCKMACYRKMASVQIQRDTYLLALTPEAHIVPPRGLVQCRTTGSGRVSNSIPTPAPTASLAKEVSNTEHI